MKTIIYLKNGKLVLMTVATIVFNIVYILYSDTVNDFHAKEQSKYMSAKLFKIREFQFIFRKLLQQIILADFIVLSYAQ